MFETTVCLPCGHFNPRWMMTSAFRILGVSCVLFAWASSSRAEDLSAEKKYRSAVIKAAKERDSAIEAARAEYLAALKDQLLEETKKGNLDAAVALRSKVNRVESQAKATQSILR